MEKKNTRKPKIVKDIEALISPDVVWKSKGCCGHLWFFDKDFDGDGSKNPSYRLKYDVRHKRISTVFYNHNGIGISIKTFKTIDEFKDFWIKVSDFTLAIG